MPIVENSTNTVADTSTRRKRANSPLPQRPRPGDATEKNVPTQPTNPEYEKLLSEWQAPIEFHGKVVDENDIPVEGASATFFWTENPFIDGKGNRSTTTSDSQGLFSLEGARGPSLNVEVGKSGYYQVRSNRTQFQFGIGAEPFRSDASNPMVFHLRKKSKGERLIATTIPGFAGIEQLRSDGSPVEVDLMQGSRVPAGRGQLKLEFWRDLTDRKARVYNWRLQLSAPGGGLVGTADEFPFEAPEGGYESALTIDMPATNQPWQPEIRRKFFAKLADGSYGCFEMYLVSWNGVFTIQSSINPTGSRNLEPAEAPKQTRPLPPGVPPEAIEVIPQVK
jgi:hypothetical protein